MKDWFQLEEYDSLNKIREDETTPSTSILVQTLGRSTVSCGLRVYRIILEIEKTCKPPLLGDQIEKAARILNEDVDSLVTVLSSDKKMTRRIEYGRHFEPRGKGGQESFPYKILVYFLAKHLEHKTGNVDVDLIADSIVEQGIKDNLNANAVWKTYNYANGNTIHQVYMWFWSIYAAATIAPIGGETSGKVSLEEILESVHETRRAAVDNPKIEKDLLFPSFEQFMKPEEDKDPDTL
ncbi:MAG: hypothetical protein C4576_14215 [Desulfobacteraceae bacterium]|nr:MAG: hypothetical protein C4576_14215 [Desulfobacteraceae bacterium]